MTGPSPPRFRLARLGALFLALAAAPAVAWQDPFADRQASVFTPASQGPAAQAYDPAGNALVVWTSTDGTAGPGVYGRRFAADGRALGPELELVSESDSGTVALASSAKGYVLAWEDFYAEIVCVERLDFDARPLGSERCFGGHLYPQLAAQADGRFVLAAVSSGKRSQVRAWFFDAGGQTLGETQPVAESDYTPLPAPDAAGGFFIAGTDERGVWGRRYDAAGSPLGAVFRIAQDAFATGAAGDGRGLVRVVWQSNRGGVYLSSLEPGRAARAPVLVSGAGDFGSGSQVAMLADGRTLVAWDFLEAGAWRVMGRLFSPAGRPASAPFRLSHSVHEDSVESAAASPAGRFLVTFYRYMVEENHDDIWMREVRWATAGDEPCLYREGRFVCDLRHGAPPDPAELRFGGAPGDRPLLGDLDGDGLVEACVVRGPRLLCDAGHDGGAAELAIDFGYGTADGDVPLLGDLDGEGRADPCVRRSDRFLCDTAHNGGTAELVVRFGEPGDAPFLADVDGDADADPCVLRDRVLACDRVHDGGAPDVRIPFDVDPAAGDVPLLGDVDGDGRADPCVFRAGKLLCDADRDGRFDLSLPPAAGGGGIPLFGNVDGIGGAP